MWGTSGCDVYSLNWTMARLPGVNSGIVQKENKDKYKKMIIMQASDSVLSIKGTVVEDVLTSFT